MRTQEVQPAWPGLAEQGMTAVGRLGAQGAGPQEAKVATRKPPRPTEPWDSSTSNNPPSGPQGWGQAEPVGYIALWVRAGLAPPSSSVEVGTYGRTEHEAHSLMTLMGLGEPRRVSLRHLQLGGHLAHCQACGFFFLSFFFFFFKKAFLFFLLPNVLGSSTLTFDLLLTMIMPLSLNFPYWVYLKFTLSSISPILFLLSFLEHFLT